MNTHRGRIGKIAASLGIAMSVLLLATCEGPLLEEIREAKQAAGEAVYYTVTYDGNGATSGDVPIDEAKYEQGQTVIVLGNDGDLQKADHNFAGWNTSPDGDGQPYGRGSPLLIGTANVTLYANWTQLQVYEASFDSQGGSFDSPGNPEVLIQEVTEGNLASKPTDPTRDGYTFGGWYKESSCSNAWNFSTDLVTESLSLYAKWTGIEYNVTLNMAVGSGGSNEVTPTYGSPMPQDDMIAPSRTGYNFGGYFTGTNGTGTQYYTASMSSARPWEETDVSVLYAKWIAIEYEVTLNNDGGSGGSAKVFAILGQPMPEEDVTAPTKSGAVFDGYYIQHYTAPGGTGAQYYDASMQSVRDWDIAQNTQLVAHWAYQLGDNGPAEGIVFYDKGTYTDGWRYLEAAPASTQWFRQWGGYGVEVGASAQGTGIGTGEGNTEAIVDVLGGPGTYAAYMCWDLSHEGYSDWFLPSKDELNLMWQQREVIGGFYEYGHFWSSSEVSSHDAWNQWFYASIQSEYAKNTEAYVRAVRRF